LKIIAAKLLILLGVVGVAFANPGPPPLAPEIDPGSVVTASALIGSVVLMTRRRIKH